MKKYNQALILITISIVLIVGFLNVIIDPFNVFHTKNHFNRIRPNIDKNQRISLIPSFKFDKRDINSIWVGSSKTGWGLCSEYESEIANANVVSLTLNSSSIDEAIEMATNAMIIHPEIKKIYWGIDFAEMKQSAIKKTNSVKLTNQKNITKEELLPLIISLDTFSDTSKTIQKNLKRNVKISSCADYGNKKEYNSKIINKYKDTAKKYYRDYYKNYKLNYDTFKKIENFIKESKDKGVEVIIFATTMHITERILIDNTNNSKAFSEFKRELSKIQPYYDFAVVDKYTTDEIRPDMQYFRDTIHAHPFVRKKITNQLFLNNEDFGVFVNKSNVEQHIKNEEIKFQKFMKNNSELRQQVKEWSK